MSILPTLTYKFNAITIKISEFLAEIKIDSSIYMERQRNRIAKTIFEGKNKIERLTIFDSIITKKSIITEAL